MILDTSQCSLIASQIQSLKQSQWLESESMQAKQNSIQAALDALQNFFKRLSQIGIETEDSIFTAMPYLGGGKSGLQASGSVQGNVGTVMAGGSLKASGMVHYAFGAIEKTYSSDLIKASASANALEVTACSSAVVQLYKKGGISDPKLDVQAQISASLANVKASASIGNSAMKVEAHAKGEAGALYATAKAVIKCDEQTLEAGIGAAALRGECAVSFNVLGCIITLTGQGSLGSAEANLSYSHKNREWEVGSKLGFIAGLGFKLKVSY